MKIIEFLKKEINIDDKVKNILAVIKSYFLNHYIKPPPKTIIINVIIAISAVVFVVSAYNIGLWLYDNYKTAKINDNISEVVSVETTEELINDTSSSGSSYAPVDPQQFKFLTTNISKLKKQNSDTVAFLKVAATNVRYPIVQTKDNDYYMTHDWIQSENAAGWPFMDYRCSYKEFGKNTIIYGHERQNLTMFGSLNYLIHDYWYNNPNNHYIWLNTEKYKTIWQIFSVYVTSPSYNYIRTDFKNDADYAAFVSEIKSKNQVPTLIYDVAPTDKILTLSTCHGKNRLAVHAKLLRIEGFNGAVYYDGSSQPASSEVVSSAPPSSAVSSSSPKPSSSKASSSKAVSSSKASGSSNVSSSSKASGSSNVSSSSKAPVSSEQTLSSEQASSETASSSGDSSSEPQSSTSQIIRNVYY